MWVLSQHMAGGTMTGGDGGILSSGTTTLLADGVCPATTSAMAEAGADVVVSAPREQSIQALSREQGIGDQLIPLQCRFKAAMAAQQGGDRNGRG